MKSTATEFGRTEFIRRAQKSPLILFLVAGYYDPPPARHTQHTT